MKLLDSFVCVRLVKMQGVDLGQFQFDYDLTWSAFFLNADGSVYGRYGARNQADAMALNSIKGLAKSLKRALALHEAYPKNREELLGKRGKKPRWAKPELMPVAVMKKRKGQMNLENCIHCHMLHDAERELLVKAGKYRPSKLFRFPPPTSIGIDLDVDDGLEIKEVKPGSLAGKAGLRKGDHLYSMNGQPLISIADIIWVLHGVGESGVLSGVFMRSGKKQSFSMKLAKGWRPPNLAWRESMYHMPPAPGLWIEAISMKNRKALGIASDKLALRVRGLFKAPVRRSGLRTGDVIVSVDGREQHHSPGEFHQWIRLEHFKKGSKLRLEILRRKERRKIVVQF